MLALKKIRNLRQSYIFLSTDSDQAKQEALRFSKETKFCPSTHVFHTNSVKGLLYETMYEILEKQITSFLSELESRTSTRLVEKNAYQISSLLELLHRRKGKSPSLLTNQCIAKIESYVFEFDLIYNFL